MLLETPPENPCFGCGKANPRGLHLDFERRRSDSDAREVVACTFVPREDEIGWPGLLPTGLHQLVLFEVSYRAALTVGGKVHRFGGEARLCQERLPRVGRRRTVEASVASSSPELRVEATSTNDKGAVCGRLESDRVPASRKAVAAAGVVLPQYLLDEMEP